MVFIHPSNIPDTEMATRQSGNHLSTYDSIVPYYYKYWCMLDDTHVLAMLHDKCWAKSMEDEEEEWRKAQPENELMNADEDGDVIGPGCYILDLGIPGLGRSKLWIRKEYIQLYDFCEKYLDSCRGEEPPSVVITGQPGIGKSYWVQYALRRRLAEGKPVMWYRDSRQYLFVEEGVYEVPQYCPSTDFKTLVWTLVDADECPNGIPSYLAVHDTKHFNVFVSYPQSSRWEPLEKTTQCAVIVMNPWTKTEISQAAVVHGLVASDPRIDAMYDRFGPTPRICFDLLRNKVRLAGYQSHYDAALEGLSLEVLLNAISMANNLKLNVEDTSHVLLMKRVPKEELIRANLEATDGAEFVYAGFEPITHAVKVKLYYDIRSKNGYLRQCIAELVCESSKSTTSPEFKVFPIVQEESSGSDHPNK
ncbi:hypothetical protein EDB86DRAFT_2926188 [Lactarius hatsudake]|nr:hypothetical protein EDB86DRAFT_2926188 [Lactarius hatsudake]